MLSARVFSIQETRRASGLDPPLPSKPVAAASAMAAPVAASDPGGVLTVPRVRVTLADLTAAMPAKPRVRVTLADLVAVQPSVQPASSARPRGAAAPVKPAEARPLPPTRAAQASGEGASASSPGKPSPWPTAASAAPATAPADVKPADSKRKPAPADKLASATDKPAAAPANKPVANKPVAAPAEKPAAAPLAAEKPAPEKTAAAPAAPADNPAPADKPAHADPKLALPAPEQVTFELLRETRDADKPFVSLLQLPVHAPVKGEAVACPAEVVQHEYEQSAGYRMRIMRALPSGAAGPSLEDEVSVMSFKFSLWHNHFSNTVLIVSAFTLSNYRRRGWSALLYSWLGTVCRHRGIETVQVSVHGENTAGKAFHKQLGFRVVRQAHGYLEQVLYLNGDPDAEAKERRARRPERGTSAAAPSPNGDAASGPSGPS